VIELAKLMTGYDNSHVRFWFCDHFADRLSLGKKNGSTSVEKDTAREVSTRDTAQAAPTTPSNLPTEPPAIKPLRFHLKLDPDVPYLRQRGVTAETAQRYGIGLCCRGVLKGYVAMPVYSGEANGNPIGYLGRWPGSDFDESKGRPRYKFPDEFPRNRVLYGLHFVAHSPTEGPVVVVEGPFSVFHLFQCGVDSVVATLGSTVSDEQAALLVELRRPILLAFDGDEAGQRGTQAAMEKLATRAYVRTAGLADGQQPTDLSQDVLRDLVA
jgi:DNA primase